MLHASKHAVGDEFFPQTRFVLMVMRVFLEDANRLLFKSDFIVVFSKIIKSLTKMIVVVLGACGSYVTFTKNQF